MKKFVLACALAALFAVPAKARADVYSSWADCMAVATAADHFDQWTPYCVAEASGGWKLVWTQDKRKGKK